MRKRLRILILTGIVIFFIAVTCHFSLAIREDLTLYHPESYGQWGYKGVFLLLQKAGFALETVEELPPETTGPAVIFTRKFLSPEKLEGILQWVKSGGTVVEMAHLQPQLVSADKEFKYRTIGAGRRPAVSEEAIFSRLFYYPKGGGVFTLCRPENGLYRLEEDYLIYTHAYGEGRIVTWTDPRGLVNAHVKEYPDNAVIFILLLQNLAVKGDTLFFMNPGRDYFSFSAGEARWSRPNQVGIILLLAVGFLVFWQTTVRFGRPRPLPEKAGRSYGEFVDSLAELFQQAGAGEFILERLLTELTGEISEIAKLPPEAGPEILAARLQKITGGNYQRLVEIAGKTGKKKNRRRLFSEALCLERYREELAAWKKSEKWWGG